MGKEYAGLPQLPTGKASEKITKGCIVLEGGAFRGLYGQGVLDALMQADINMECVIGVSAGAMNGMNYVSGQIGRSVRLNLKYRHDARYVGRKAVLQNHGLVGFEFILREVNGEDPFDRARFFDLRRRFVAVATNCESGEATYFERDKCRDILLAVQASASMPFLSKAVWIDGYPYLDGGCSCRIPYQWALQQGYEHIVVVRTRPRIYRKESMSQKEKRLTERIYRKYPAFIDVFCKSNDVYNQECGELEELAASGRIYMLAPKQAVTVGRLEGNLTKLAELYRMGYEDTRLQMDAVRHYLREKT